MKKLLSCIAALFTIFSIVSCLQEERSPEEILVPSPAEVDCSESFSITSKVPKGSEKLVEECGFLVGTTKDLADALTVEGAMTENTFSAALPARKYGTTYYICSYVTNGHSSEIRSEVISYDLKPLKEYIEFEPVELISYSKANRKAKVSFRAEIWSGVSVSETGVCFGVTTSPSEDGKHQSGNMSEDGVVTATLSNFDVDTQYYLRAYVKDGESVAYGEVIPLIIRISPPSLTSVIVSSVGASSALFSSSVTDNGGDAVSEVGFYYNTDEAVDPETSSKINQPYSEDSFSLQADELTPNTKYYVKAFAVNSAGTGYSQIVDFTTSAGVPSVSTLGTVEVTSTSAELSGEVSDDNGAEITERGFVWLQGTGTPTTDSFKLKVDGEVGEYSATLEGLDPNQKYSFRAYAINSKGTAYGEIMTFSTVAGLPTLSAMKVSSITTTSATFTCTVTSHGGETVSEVGFYIGKDEEVDVETAQKVSETYSSDNFTLSAEDLEIGQDYYVKAFAKNYVGESYSAVNSFKTTSTAPSVSTIGSSEITSSSALLSGEVTDDNGEDITERGFVWMKGTGTPTTSSNKVQVNGTTGELTTTLSGLEPNQTYSFRAYAVNSKGTSYGETSTFETEVALPAVEFTSCSDITSSSATVSGKVTYHGGETVSEVGFLYGTTSDLDPSTASKVKSTYNGDSFSFTLSGLTKAKDYYVQPFATNSAGTSYGESAKFTTLPDLPTVTTNDVTDITDNSAVSGGVIVDDGGGEILAKGLVWGMRENPTIDNSTKTDEGAGLSAFNSVMTGLFSGSTYYVCAYATNASGISYGEQKEFRTTGEIQGIPLEASNSFIISYPGTYVFQTVKGNSLESVGDVASAEVLWESFGTDEQPEIGLLVSLATYKNGKISFTTLDPFREGNAVIAAKDLSGTILWSWHIWLTDQPQEQVYYNNAGTMMDRNLGATSATPGDVGALGLLYQWGRKDPFLGSSSISSEVDAQSTITWPWYVSSDSSNGTIEYAVEHPTTFITRNSHNNDWYYTGLSSTDNTRWQSEKTIYDPCPVGWRVPDGGDNGVWSTSKSMSSSDSRSYDNTNEGMNFSGDFGESSTIWYPASGFRTYYDVTLCDVGHYGMYWSVTPNSNNAYYLLFNSKGGVGPTNNDYRAYGLSVRCMKEGTGGGEEPGSGEDGISTSEAVSLSDDGSANSYIVSESGTYSIPAVKGNSSASVGSVSRVEVLWESFGTDVIPSKGDLVKTALYENGKIYFKTSDTFKEGNAVIAAKDASGTILWSWHIWLTDEPQEQVYYNNAGTMMDRNLGATSATPGDVGALGLQYQWGRKDPFLGSSSIDSGSEKAMSTINWPSTVSSDLSTGTITYAIEHPTTFIGYNSSNYDWYYTGLSSTDNTRWQSEKTIYDPCPVGWRVPDGGEEGVWSTAKGTSSYYTRSYDDTNKGMNFSGDFGAASTIWYPASGLLSTHGGYLDDVGNVGYSWSCSPNPGSSKFAYILFFSTNGKIYPVLDSHRAFGMSVRCFQE